MKRQLTSRRTRVIIERSLGRTGRQPHPGAGGSGEPSSTAPSEPYPFYTRARRSLGPYETRYDIARGYGEGPPDER